MHRWKHFRNFSDMDDDLTYIMVVMGDVGEPDDTLITLDSNKNRVW